MKPAQRPHIEKFTVVRRSVNFVKDNLGYSWWKKSKSTAPMVREVMLINFNEDIMG